jgi:transcriptional regulator with XRE-family HTH domain
MKGLEITDQALADKVGCTRAAITKLRLGYMRPSLDMARRLSEATGLSMDKLSEIRATKREKR